MVSPRVHEVDVIRLVALLGICVANIPTMGIYESYSVSPTPDSLDQYTNLFRGLFIEGKFILLFSFIFGWGIAVQEKRITEAGHRFEAYYFRRALGLIVLGCAHMVFVFGGDILMIYGFMSLAFWPMRHYALRTPLREFIKRMIILNYAVIVLAVIAIIVAMFMFDFDDMSALIQDNRVLGGSFIEASLYRMSEGGTVLLLSLVFFLVQGLAAFGLGYAAEYKGFFQQDNDVFQQLKPLLPRLLVIGLVCNIPYAMMMSEMSENNLIFAGFLLWFVGAPMLSAVYLYGIILFARRIQLPEILTLAGRNSLSVYVLQGIIASVLFGGYGFGLFGQFGDLQLIPISIGICIVAMLIVGLYAKKFGRGFLEPILRVITGHYPSRL